MEFRLLGPLAVRHVGRPVQIAGHRTRALLCVLLLQADEVVATERLIDALWEDEPPPSALHALHVQASKLRAALRDSSGEAAQIVTEAGGYRLRLDGHELDVLRFEQLVADGRRQLAAQDADSAVETLRTAEALWRGAPLADFATAAFARPVIVRLDEVRLSAIETRIEAQLATGAADEVVAELEGLAAANPLRERLRRLLMLALYRTGRQARALEVYRQTRQLLADELGVEPSPELQQLMQDILAQDAALLAASATPRSGEPLTAAAHDSGPVGAIAAPPPSLRDGSRAGRLRKRPWVLVASVLVLAGGVTTGVVLAHGDGVHGRVTLGENSLGVVDPATGRVVGQVGIDVGPSAVAAGFGSVWTTNIDDDTVSRVDTSSRQVVDTIKVGVAPSAIATGSGSVWVTDSGDGTVARIDPTTGEPRIIRVGVAPSGVVVAHGSVWVTNAADGTVSRIDPAQGREVQRIAVDSGASGIAAGRDIWVANSASNTVTKIDGQDPTFTQRIHVGDGPRGIAVVGNTVWVSYNGSDKIARIATSGTSVTDLVPVGAHPDQIVATGGHVWATRQGGGALVEIDPDRDTVVRTMPVGPTPGGIATAGGKVWVTTSADPSAHRGGTLHLAGPVDSVDPTYVAEVDQTSVLAGSYDGLVAFGHLSGADGLTIVPDLATAIPEPSAGGRSYTFELRRGIRFSSGRAVTVADVRDGIQRAAAQSSPGGLAALLVGGRDCRRSRCHMSGISTDAAVGTLTIRLVRPSGNLLDLLAGSGAYAVPPGTPIGLTDHPIPATGPYQISQFVPHKIIVFTRNAYFHEWSAAAQPSGFPDRIEYRIAPSGNTKAAVDAVAAGHADWADVLDGGTDLDPSTTLDALRTRFGNRLRVTPNQFMYGLFLNTRIAPFDQPKLRQALAFAIDRKAVIDDWFAPAAVTCQFLPPDYPGYRPYCPYTPQSGADLWQGSDVGRALELVKGLHPERTPVTVWASPATRAGMQHVVDALRVLHFRARLRVWPNWSFNYFTYVFDSRHRVQAAFMGWLGYDASAANLFALYRCDAFVPGGASSNLNPAEFCDPSIDRLMRRAEAVQATSLAQADQLWVAVERRLVDAAPWIPLVNPYSLDVLSERVHNFKRTPAIGVLFDQMWVR